MNVIVKLISAIFLHFLFMRVCRGKLRPVSVEPGVLSGVTKQSGAYSQGSKYKGGDIRAAMRYQKDSYISSKKEFYF